MNFRFLCPPGWEWRHEDGCWMLGHPHNICEWWSVWYVSDEALRDVAFSALLIRMILEEVFGAQEEA